MNSNRKSATWGLATDQAAIANFCQMAREERAFAFDTEFVMEDRYEPEVCLVQLASRDGVLLIDPFSGLDLGPVWELIHEAGVECIVHAGQEDLALCVQHTGILPRNVFDVQIAAGLVGFDYPIGLQKLVQALLRVRLHKSKTLTDWRKRPLSEAQLQYAVEDVGYLHQIRAKLGRRLEERRRVDWAAEELSVFEDMNFYRRVEEEKVRHLKGTRGLGGQQLAVVRDLLHWRDGLAQKLNRPARVALKDHLLVEIARLGLRSVEEVRDLRGLNLSDRSVHELVQVVRKSMESASADWPEPVPHDIETPRDTALVALATAVVRGYCLEHDVAYSLAATKKMIQDLIRFRLDDLGESHTAPSAKNGELELLQGWRGRTVGALLSDVLSGRVAVFVDVQNGEPAIRVKDIPQ